MRSPGGRRNPISGILLTKTKIIMNRYTVKYGLLGSVTNECEEGTTVGELLRSPAIRGALGYGENIQAVIRGQVVSMNEEVQHGDEILVEKKAAEKAA